MDLIHTLLDRRGIFVLMGVFAFLFLVESLFRLRRRKQTRTRRFLINALFAVPGFFTLRFLLIPALVWLADRNSEWGIGLNFLYHFPAWAECLIAFLVLDYGNYLWHILNHKVPFLWRFHLVHHTDIDMDVTTAIRFHFVELVTSVVFRGFVVLISGATPALVLIYEICFEAANQFHHSNWRLPYLFERWLNAIVVTPRMHGIHHSVIRKETDSNYSVIFSFWDRLHGSINLNIPQSDVTIGVPVYSDPKELTPLKMIGMPFTAIRRWDDKEPPRGTSNPGELAK